MFLLWQGNLPWFRCWHGTSKNLRSHFLQCIFLWDFKQFSTNSVALLILPLLDCVKDIVDKTASFVARNGPEFESRIRQNEQNNAKFNFLNPADPYHAYYQHKVKEFREGKGKRCWTLSYHPKTTRPAIFENVLGFQSRNRSIKNGVTFFYSCSTSYWNLL